MDKITKSVFYLDFDNVYGQLLAVDESAAEEFATNPGVWMSRLGWYKNNPRRFLARICYMNPTGKAGNSKSFSSFRANFVNAGFKIVDCPSMTAQGKNSSDIRIVIDVCEALKNPSYEEFIIASADSDFVPLMQHVTSYDRLVTAITTSYVSNAYRASCDLLIDTEEFMTEILGVSAEEEPEVKEVPKFESPTRPRKDPKELTSLDVKKVQEEVTRLVRLSSGPVPLAALAQRLSSVLSQKRSNGWGQYKTLAEFLESLDLDNVQIVRSPSPGWILDPSRSSLSQLDEVLAQERRGHERLPKDLEKLCRTLGVPARSGKVYSDIFTAISSFLPLNDSKEWNSINRGVVKKCSSHSDINRVVGFVLQGLSLRHAPKNLSLTPKQISEQFIAQVHHIARRKGVDLDRNDEKTIETWLKISSK